MPINFPDSPQNADTFNAAGKNWVYNGNVWVLVGVSTLPIGGSLNLDGGTASSTYGGITAINGGGA